MVTEGTAGALPEASTEPPRFLTIVGLMVTESALETLHFIVDDSRANMLEGLAVNEWIMGTPETVGIGDAAAITT